MEHHPEGLSLICFQVWPPEECGGPVKVGTVTGEGITGEGITGAGKGPGPLKFKELGSRIVANAMMGCLAKIIFASFYIHCDA